MDERTTENNEREVVNYVPDEVCVVVAADGIADGAAFYEHVRTRLNARLVRLLRQNDKQEPSSPLGRDLSPSRLAARFAQDPVRLLGEPIDRFRRQPWSLAATTPNWLIAAAPFSCGSPAGLPLVAAPENAQHGFSFADA